MPLVGGQSDPTAVPDCIGWGSVTHGEDKPMAGLIELLGQAGQVLVLASLEPVLCLLQGEASLGSQDSNLRLLVSPSIHEEVFLLCGHGFHQAADLIPHTQPPAQGQGHQHVLGVGVDQAILVLQFSP